MIENDAFKLLLINLFHLNPNDITNIVCTTFNKMMVLLVTLADKHQACPYCGFTAPKIKEYVTNETINGVFKMVADKESGIRNNSVMRTTSSLQKVFGVLDSK